MDIHVNILLIFVSICLEFNLCAFTSNVLVFVAFFVCVHNVFLHITTLTVAWYLIFVFCLPCFSISRGSQSDIHESMQDIYGTLGRKQRYVFSSFTNKLFRFLEISSLQWHYYLTKRHSYWTIFLEIFEHVTFYYCVTVSIFFW